MKSKINYEIRYYKKRFRKREYSGFVLGGDVGGTNTNLGIAGVKSNKPVLLFSIHFKTQELDSLVPAVNETITYARENHGIVLKQACFAVAGPVSPGQQLPKLTNADWGVSAKEVLKKTALRSVLLINDLQAVGYGINVIEHARRKDIYTVRKSHHKELKATRAVVAPGTGLGTSILVYDDCYEAHIPIPSEGGHSDFPVHNKQELEITDFIRKLRRISQPVDNEEVLSGRGIEAIYMFLRKSGKFSTTEYTKEIDRSKEKTQLISEYRSKDPTCRETFRLFAKFCGRRAKNLVVDAVALGGLYIGGGIAAKNCEVFKSKDFLKEFEDVYKLGHIPKQTPVYVITNYNANIYGACYAAVKRQDLAIKKS